MSSTVAEDDEDVQHASPYDRSNIHIWFFEDKAKDGHVLTQDGMTQIAEHKYKGGEYTHLDNFMNPFWNYCTEHLIPMSVAPNMVTLVGGMACLLSYLATWWYIPQFEEQKSEGGVPPELFLLNGLAIFFYHTADSCDGKQARRTGTSSPLGQLFDHGLDCFANLTHLSVCQTFLLMGPTRDYLWTQVGGLQLAFFATQWEEYYTGTLQHSYGKYLGVTEVNYGVALASLAAAVLDVKGFFELTVQQALLPILPISLLPDNPSSPSAFVSVLHTVLTAKCKQCLLVGWVTMVLSIVLGCIYRVMNHLDNATTMASAMTKMISPLVVAAMVLVVTPTEAIQQEARLISISSGLCICFITVKIIIFSMARMAYASIQKDILPTVLVLGFIAYEYDYAEHRRLKPLGLTVLLQALSLYYMFRICYWLSIAIQQLCEKLDVYLLTIKPKKG